jgi:hypothetical protein
LKETLRDMMVDTGAVVLAAVEGKNLQDGGGKSSVSLTKAEVVVNSGLTTENRHRGVGSGDVKWEREDTADSGNGAGDVGTVDGTSVPSVSGGLGNAVEHELGWNSTGAGFDGEGLVENFEPTFDGEGFVVARGDAIVTDVEELAHSDEVTFEFTVGIDNNKAAKTDFEKDMSHEEIRKGFGGGLGNSFAEDKSSEIAHSGHEVGMKAFEFHVKIRDTTGFPEVDMEDIKR